MLMKTITIFYFILLLIATIAADSNNKELVQNKSLNTPNKQLDLPVIDSQVPSNNKPLSLKGPTIDAYNENKDLKIQNNYQS